MEPTPTTGARRPAPASRDALRWIFGALLAALAACSLAHRGDDPDVVTRVAADPAFSDRAMVASSSAEANRVGVEVLRAGGNAVDAAVAVAVALGVVDAGDSGLGGSAVILVRMADGRAVAIDGSPAVPIQVDWKALGRIQDEDRKAGPELAAVPGALAALDHALRRFGTIGLRDAIGPSIPLASAGSVVTPFQRGSILKYLDDVRATSPLDRILLDDAGDAIPVGAVLRWPGLDRTLRRIAERGAGELYHGAMAAEIEADMRHRGGFVRSADLALYRVRELEPLRTTYRGREVLGFPLPGAGGAVVAGLNILGHFPPALLATDGVERLQVLAEAFHIALEDQRRTLDQIAAPQAAQDVTYLSREHARRRAALIVPGRPVPPDALGSPGWRPDLESQTVQVSVVDADGNAVALTQSLGRFYGNKIVADGLGFPYNTFLSGLDAHRPGEVTMRSPIATDGAPTIVVEDGRPLLVLGASGSSRIPGAVATVISNVVDRGMPLGRAIEAPRSLWSAGNTTKGLLLEVRPPVTVAHARKLEAMGYEDGRRERFPIRYEDLSRFGGVNAVHRDPATGRLTGVGDPRRNGHALGLGPP